MATSSLDPKTALIVTDLRQGIDAIPGADRVDDVGCRTTGSTGPILDLLENRW